jgi:hypothetical protein
VVFPYFRISTAIYVDAVGVGASANFNITTTANSNNVDTIIAVYSGVNGTIDVTANNTAASGTITNTGNITQTSTAPQLWVGSVATYGDADGQDTPQNGFTLTSTVPAGAIYLSGAYLEKISYVTGAASSGTTVTSSHWAGCIAALEGETTGYEYTFNGVYDENIDAGLLIGSANITAYFDDGTSPCVFLLNDSAMYAPATLPLYFYYDIWSYSNTSDTALHREYWLSPTETNGTFYVYGNQQGLENIVFTIRALGGAGLGSYVSVQRNIAGSLQTVEKRPVDSTGAVVMSLQAFTLYTVSIEGTEPNTSTTFGNINTYTTPIVLTVSALSFPSSTLQQYKYLAIWASRPTSTDIMVNYNDTNLQTVSVYYEISDANGTVHYNFTHTGENSFSDIWTSALANTTYYLEATVVQSVFGTTVFKQILAKDGTTASPIDLSFLGTWEFSIYGVTVSLEASQVFWALVVLIIFGSFSVLNAYMGAFAGVAAAAVFVGLGWLDIPAGAVALAFAFTVVIGIAVYKRRGN